MGFKLVQLSEKLPKVALECLCGDGFSFSFNHTLVRSHTLVNLSLNILFLSFFAQSFIALSQKPHLYPSWLW